MRPELKDRFTQLFEEYFPGAELPIAFFYTDDPAGAGLVVPPDGWSCLIAQLGAVRQGESLYFDANSISCFGGKRCTGFSQKLMPNFEYFLSCGIPGELEGERYKKSPELVRQIVKKWSSFETPARYIVFKRWDRLEASDEPAVVVFFAQPDVLAGLFTLANYRCGDPEGVFTPMAAGCSTIVQYPYLEAAREEPRAVIGLFDVSARPWVKRDILTFAVPMKKFAGMVDDMEESFLITPSWDRVKRRMAPKGPS